MRALIVCLAMFLVGCEAKTPKLPEAQPPPTPNVTYRELHRTFAISITEMRIEDKGITCWLYATGTGASIACLPDKVGDDRLQ